jgi:hypothetical protein
MKLTVDRALRWIWLLIGAGLLLFLIVGGVLAVAQMIGNAGASEDAVRVAKEAGAPRQEVRAVRYHTPVPIRGTDTRMVLIGYGEGYEPGPSLSGGGYAGYGREAPEVNAVFLDAAGARLLVDRPAFIHDVRLPGEGRSHADSLATWITFVMSLDDADGNGRLDDRDPPALYVTDRDGRNLRAVLRPPLRYRAHQALDGARMLVYALEPPAGQRVDADRMRQRAFIYDVASGQLSPYAALDSAAARAAQVLGR